MEIERRNEEPTNRQSSNLRTIMGKVNKKDICDKWKEGRILDPDLFQRISEKGRKNMVAKHWQKEISIFGNTVRSNSKVVIN